jgi:hypothetical protein
MAWVTPASKCKFDVETMIQWHLTSGSVDRRRGDPARRFLLVVENGAECLEPNELEGEAEGDLVVENGPECLRPDELEAKGKLVIDNKAECLGPDVLEGKAEGNLVVENGAECFGPDELRRRHGEEPIILCACSLHPFLLFFHLRRKYHQTNR